MTIYPTSPYPSSPYPAEQINLAELTDDENLVLNRLLAQLDAATPGNLLRDSYYDGKRAIRQVGTIIPPQYYRLGIVLGWSAKAVDILARRCNLDAFIWPDGDLESIGYRETWDGNHLGSEISSALISSLIHGPSFLVNTHGEKSNEEPPGLIHVKDALSATGDWNARSRRLDSFLSITSRNTESGRPTSFALYLDGLTIVAELDMGVWTVDKQAHSWGVPAEPMVYKPRVGRPFGTARISRPVMALHDMALRTIIRMEGHADVFSYPQMWLLGADESIFRNSDGSMKASWQFMVGRLMGIPDDEDQANPRADVKQFAASSPEPHIAQLKQQAQLFSGETSIPLTSLGVSDMSNPTSADSYIASREDLIAEAEGATDDWSPPLRRALSRALAMQNGLLEVPEKWSSIEPKWRSPVHLSRAAQADAGMKQLAAVPRLAESEVGLELLGLEEQQIRRVAADWRRSEGRRVLAELTAAAGVDTSADGAAAP